MNSADLAHPPQSDHAYCPNCDLHRDMSQSVIMSPDISFGTRYEARQCYNCSAILLSSDQVDNDIKKMRDAVRDAKDELSNREHWLELEIRTHAERFGFDEEWIQDELTGIQAM